MAAKPKGRKPAHLEMSGGKSPRQRIWEQIRELKRFTLRTLTGELPGSIHKDTTRTYVKSLVNGGYLELGSPNVPDNGDTSTGTGTSAIHGGRNVYRLVKDNGVEAPRVRKDGSSVTMGQAQENIWQTLRRTKRPVTPDELAAMASTDAVPVSPVAADDYLKNLHLAGYLQRCEGKAFQLIPAMNTGPRPPMVQRIKQIYDPNLGRVVWTQDGADGGNHEG